MHKKYTYLAKPISNRNNADENNQWRPRREFGYNVGDNDGPDDGGKGGGGMSYGGAAAMVI